MYKAVILLADLIADEYQHRYVREVRSTMNSRETEFIVQCVYTFLRCRVVY